MTEEESINSGISLIDRAVGGFEKGSAYYFCGKMGSGISALGLTFANNILENHRVLYINTIRDFNWIESCQKERFGDETYKLKEIIPQYLTKQEWEEQKTPNDTGRKVTFEIYKTKDFTGLVSPYFEENKTSNKPEIVIFVCYNIHKLLGDDKLFFEQFAVDKNVAVIVMSEFFHTEIKNEEGQKLLKTKNTLEAISHDSASNRSKGVLTIYGAEYPLELDVKKGIWREA